MFHVNYMYSHLRIQSFSTLQKVQTIVKQKQHIDINEGRSVHPINLAIVSETATLDWASLQIVYQLSMECLIQSEKEKETH